MRRFGISRETVRSATAIPSFMSSPWIRGAPHKGFIAAIFLTRAAISALMDGRPSRGRPESLVQCSRKRRRCHRRTVSGVTMRRGRLHPAHTRDSQTQKSRSLRAQPRPARRPLVHGELLAQGEVLQGELALAAAEEREESKQTFSGSCQAIFLGRCRSCCRAIVAKWYCSSYGTWRSHRTKMIFTHFAPNARSAS